MEVVSASNKPKKWPTEAYVWVYIMRFGEIPVGYNTIEELSEMPYIMVGFICALFQAYSRGSSPPTINHITQERRGSMSALVLAKDFQTELRKLSYYKTNFKELKEEEWDSLSELIYVTVITFEESTGNRFGTANDDFFWKAMINSNEEVNNPISTIEDYENNPDSHGNEIKRLKHQLEEFDTHLNRLNKSISDVLGPDSGIERLDSKLSAQMKIVIEMMQSHLEYFRILTESHSKITSTLASFQNVLTSMNEKKGWLW